MSNLDQKAKTALKSAYTDLILANVGGEAVPGGIAIHDASGEWIVINPVVKTSFDIDKERALMTARADRATAAAEKAAKKAADADAAE